MKWRCLLSDHWRNPDSSSFNLARDALYRGQVRRVYDISFNEATAKLREMGPSALSLIESVLLDEIGDCRDEPGLATRFRGLGELMVTYFEIAKESEAVRAAEFLGSLPELLQNEALAAIWSIWIGRSRQGEIPVELI